MAAKIWVQRGWCLSCGHEGAAYIVSGPTSGNRVSTLTCGFCYSEAGDWGVAYNDAVEIEVEKDCACPEGRTAPAEKWEVTVEGVCASCLGQRQVW